MHRIVDFARGTAAFIATLAVIGGLPFGLTATVGWPLPTKTPSVDVVQRHLANGDLPDLFVIKMLALIVWFLWAQFTVAVLVEARAAIAGRTSRSAPLLPGVQLLAAKLVTWVTLVLSAFAPARPVVSASLTPIETTTSLVHVQAESALLVGDEPAADLREPNQRAANTAKAPFAYQTGRSDSWWSIAEDLLGDGLRWAEVREANLRRTMADGTTISAATETVRAGWHLTLPVDAKPSPADGLANEEGEEATVVVEPGDHFWGIAEAELTEAWGRQPTDSETAPYWAEVVTENIDQLLPPGDPDIIYPDQRFVVPTPPTNPDIEVDVNGDRVVNSAGPTLREATPITTPKSSDKPSVPPSIAETPMASTFELVPTSPPAQEPSARDEPGDSNADNVEDFVQSFAYIAGAGLLGALLLATLRRLRHIQAARRRPSTSFDAPDTAAAEFERAIRAIATDGEHARYIAATNRYLAHQLENHKDSPLPAVIAARAGAHGVEFLLDEACAPVAGFVSGNDDSTTWQLRSDITAHIMEADAEDAHPYAPGLLVVGTTDAGDLLIDFEQLGTTSIEGDPEAVLGFQRALLAGAIAAPWGTQNQIVVIGIDGLECLDTSLITQPEDPAIWAQQTASELRLAASRAERSPYQERVDHGMVTFPTIVVIGPDPAFDAITQHLAPVAELANSDLTLITAAPTRSPHRIVVVEGITTLEPQGLAFEPVALDSEHLAATEHLLENAAETESGPNGWTEQESSPIATEFGGESEAAFDEQDDDGTCGIEAVIADIMAPQPIEVRLLGRVPRVDGLQGEASAKLEAIIAYLAFHGEVPAQRLREEFWPSSASRTGADTAMMRIRNLLGATQDGSPRLPSARGSGTYQLVEVGCDWTRAVRLIDGARVAGNVKEEAAFLDTVCELVDGRIAADASLVNYSWLLRDPGTYTQIETALVDAAHRRAELALDAGDIARANWAARKGLTVVEGQESLHRIRMQAAAEAGDADGVNAAYREARRAAESYGFDEEVQPETQTLYESLVGRNAVTDRSGGLDH